MYGSTLFSSKLFEPPELSVDYFRDNLTPDLTRDFSFLGALLANWQKNSNEIFLLYSFTNDKRAFRFKSKKGNYLLKPLSKKRAESEIEEFRMRSISYSEILRYFVSRFYQYRLIYKRSEIRKQHPECYVANGYFAVQDECNINEQCLNELMLTTRLDKFKPTKNSQNSAEVYCIKDGWVKPTIETWFGQGEVGIKYLLCPHCLGNIDYAMTTER